MSRESRDREIVRRYGAGDPIKDICDALDVSPSLVVRKAKAAGLPLRRPRVGGEREMEVVRRARSGESYKDIAADLEMAESTVSHVAREHGILPRSGWPDWMLPIH